MLLNASCSKITNLCDVENTVLFIQRFVSSPIQEVSHITPMSLYILILSKWATHLDPTIRVHGQ